MLKGVRIGFMDHAVAGERLMALPEHEEMRGSSKQPLCVRSLALMIIARMGVASRKREKG